MEKDELMERLTKISQELNRKFGTESYDIRCQLYDIREAIKNMGYPKSDSSIMYISTKCSTSQQLKKDL